MSIKPIQSNSLISLGVACAMMFWGVSWPTSKIMGEYGTAEQIAFLRYVVVFFSMLPIVLFLKVPLGLQKKGWIILLLAALAISTYSILFVKGLQHGMAGAGGVLVTTMNPIFSYILGLIINKKVPNFYEKIGLAVGLFGGSILLQIWSNYDVLWASGNIYFLLAAFSWAVLSKFTAIATNYGSSMGFSLWMYLLTMLLLFTQVEITDTISLIQKADSRFWLNLIYNGLFSTTLATTFFFFATTKLGSAKASSFIFLVPFSAALSSWIIMDEKILTHTIIGGLLGMIAVFLINKDAFLKLLKK